MTRYEASGDSILVSRGETARYLGYRGIAPKGPAADRIEDCIAQLQAKCRPKAIWECFPLKMEGAAVPVLFHIQDMTFASRDLARNLQGCRRIVLMAATIGAEADFLIRRAEAADMSDAAIFQAAGAAMAEAWCDEVNRRITAAASKAGLYARPRFSPGYGDVPLSVQKDFSSLLDMPRSCGISLTDTFLMVPSKSVTAFIGLSEQETPCIPAGCEVCKARTGCRYRR